MSVKFKETVEQTSNGGGGRDSMRRDFNDRGFEPRNFRDRDFSNRDYERTEFSERDVGGRGKSRGFFGFGKHEHHGLRHDIGEAITKGEGKGGYLQVGDAENS